MFRPIGPLTELALDVVQHRPPFLVGHGTNSTKPVTGPIHGALPTKIGGVGLHRFAQISLQRQTLVGSGGSDQVEVTFRDITDQYIAHS
jgi:hypothetical protein